MSSNWSKERMRTSAKRAFMILPAGWTVRKLVSDLRQPLKPRK
jgi:hypothetical protein